MSDSIHEIDDRTALRVLSALTEELQEKLPDGPKIASIEDARDAINALLVEAGTEGAPNADAIGAGHARALLAMLADDPVTHDHVADLVANPPNDEQRSVELALGAAIVLGGLITWLQTKFDIDFKREDGETSFRFRARKDAVDKDLIAETAQAVTRLF